MLSDTQISRLLDVANAACHGGNVVDARAMYAGVLALRPGFAPALMGKALSHIVVDDFDEAERLLKCWPPCRKMRTRRRCLVCVTPWRDGKAKPKLCLPRWPPAKARERSWPPGCLKNSGKNRRLV